MAASHRPGLIYCNSCHGAFTVMTGTVMEFEPCSPDPKWALGFYLMSSSKKGISAHQLHRTLGFTYKTAWFMAHRIREAMRPTDDGQLGGEGKTVEADETYVGGKAKNRAYAKTLPRHEAVASLVERGGKVRSRHVADVTAKTLKPILVDAIAKETNLRTDQSPGLYRDRQQALRAMRQSITRSKSMSGATHIRTRLKATSRSSSVASTAYITTSAKKHLKRYLAEFDFRYNERIALGVSDQERTEKAIKGAVGRRLTYRPLGGAQQATGVSGGGNAATYV